MSADWTDLAPFKVEGHPPMWISRAAMADPETAQPYVFEDKLYWVESDPTAWRVSPHSAFEMRYADGSLVDNAAEKFVTGVNALKAKAQKLVDMLDDAEINHGGLISVETLTAKNELRLELARWK